MSAAEPFPEAADPARFRWLTSHPVIAARERALLTAVARPRPGAGAFLEIGAGDGANLANLAQIWDAASGGGEPDALALVGLDSAMAKLQFARRALSGVRLVAGDALRLPLAGGVVGGALLRDVLHHVGDRRQALGEAARVLQAGAPLTVLEANGAALLARVFSRLFPHERGLRDSTFERVRADLAATDGLVLERAERIDPAPFYRLFFHHRFGLPGLGNSALAVRAVAAVEALWRALAGGGSYLLFVARKR